MADLQTEQAVDTAASGAAVPEENRKAPGPEKRNYKKTAVIFTLTIIILLAAGVYLRYTLQDIHSSTTALADNAVTLNEKINTRINQLQDQIELLSTQLNGLSQSLAAMQRWPGNNEDWALAEIEYLLVIATHRLMLERDPHAALGAMEIAALRLKGMDDAGLKPVREQLAVDMERLKELDEVNISNLSIYLADLIERADSLPLREAVISAPEPAQGSETEVVTGETVSGLRGVWDSLWQDLKGLVVIRHKGEARRPVLRPGEEYFLYQNLRLELENARLAVLHRDTANLHTSITLLSDWLKEYFNGADAAVANVLETLGKMSTLNLDPALPDISSSLETLRAYMRQREAVNPGSGGEVPPA